VDRRGAAQIISLAQQAIAAGLDIAVALSGVSTPQELFSKILINRYMRQQVL